MMPRERKRVLTLPAALLLGACMTAGAVEAIDYDEREEGWFWYKDFMLQEEPEEVPEEEPEPPTIVVSAPEDDGAGGPAEKEGPAPMSVAWLQKKIPESIERAIDDPGENLVNVRAFAYLQRAAFDKADNFRDNMHQVVISDPILDENNRFPISTFGRQARRLRDQQEEKRRLKWLAEHVGLFYFHDAACSYCTKQLPLIEDIAREYGFNTIGISIDGSRLNSDSIRSFPDDGHAVKFRVQSVPAVVMVWPPNNAAIVSQNIVAQDELITRIIGVAQMKNILTEQVDRELGIEPDQYIGLEAARDEIDDDDPATWINYLRKQAGYEPLDFD